MQPTLPVIKKAGITIYLPSYQRSKLVLSVQWLDITGTPVRRWSGPQLYGLLEPAPDRDLGSAETSETLLLEEGFGGGAAAADEAAAALRAEAGPVGCFWCDEEGDRGPAE